jgi:hypothetical protein
MVVGAGFGAAAFHFRTQELALRKMTAAALRRTHEIGEQIDREAQLHPGEAGLALANTFATFGTSVEDQRLQQEQMDSGRRMAQTLGIALATGCGGFIWLLLIALFDRNTQRPSAATGTLAALSFMVLAASYALILRHRSSNQILFPSCFPILVGGLLPLFLLRPATVWAGGIKLGNALMLFLIPVAADLIGIGWLYYQAQDPMSILLGLSLSRNDLSEQWYLGVALAQWGASIVAFSLAWLFSKRSAPSVGSVAIIH